MSEIIITVHKNVVKFLFSNKFISFLPYVTRNAYHFPINRTIISEQLPTVAYHENGSAVAAHKKSTNKVLLLLSLRPLLLFKVKTDYNITIDGKNNHWVTSTFTLGNDFYSTVVTILKKLLHSNRKQKTVNRNNSNRGKAYVNKTEGNCTKKRSIAIIVHVCTVQSTTPPHLSPFNLILVGYLAQTSKNFSYNNV